MIDHGKMISRWQAGNWLMVITAAVLALRCAAAPATPPLRLSTPATRCVHHYAFFNRERVMIRQPLFLNARFEGAQLKYTWRELEPAKDVYDFTAIRSDAAFLRRHRRGLFIQLQDVSFHANIRNVPDYLLTQQYDGGVDRQHEDGRAMGWIARRWDATVRDRFHLLLAALGKEFDGQIVGITLPETAAGYGDSVHPDPPGFTPAKYREGVIANMKALKRAFPRSVAMQYTNFMPGEWLPENDNLHLRTIFATAMELKVAVGGPDLLPYQRGQMKHSYPLIRELAGAVPTGIAVQWGNYEHVNPRTGARSTASELLRFGVDYLSVEYVFWSAQEPFFTRDVVPLVAGARMAPCKGVRP